MEAPFAPELEGLKYSELQRLAKGAGLKANLKADKLLKMLKQHFHEIIQENGNMVNRRGSSSTDTEEVDGSQIPITVTSVTQKIRKKKGDKEDDQGDSEGKTVHEENPDFYSENEILSELNENEEPQDAECESTLKMNQTEYLANNGMAKNVVTPSQCKERISTKRRSTESKTPIDPLYGKKPRDTASLSQSGRIRFASTTPNFRKLHQAQFKKMESIDDYIERKAKLAKNFHDSVNKVLGKKSNYLKTSQKETPNSNSKTPSCSRGFLYSPHPHGNNLEATHTPAGLRRSSSNSASNANRSILTLKSAVNSSGLSSTKMNVRFSEATKDNEHKRSLIKTPSRKSPFLNAYTPDSWKSSVSVSGKDLRGSTTKSVTPKLGIPTVEPTSTKKPTFDLKASLSRPLRYQPHRGKLKPWGESKENIQRNYKQPVPTTREERRERHKKERKQRKDQALGIRRGLTLL